MDKEEILLNMKNENCRYDFETARKRLDFWLSELIMLNDFSYESEKGYWKVCKDNIDYFYYLVSEEIKKMKLPKGD